MFCNDAQFNFCLFRLNYQIIWNRLRDRWNWFREYNWNWRNWTWFIFRNIFSLFSFILARFFNMGFMHNWIYSTFWWRSYSTRGKLRTWTCIGIVGRFVGQFLTIFFFIIFWFLFTLLLFLWIFLITNLFEIGRVWGNKIWIASLVLILK